LSVLRAGPQTQDGVTKEYDRSRDETRFSMETDLPQVVSSNKATIHAAKFGVSNSCAGSVESCTSRTLSLTLRFTTQVSMFGTANIALLIDSDPTAISRLQYYSNVLDSGENLELILGEIPVAAFRKMAAARTVEFHLGSVDFTLRPETIAALEALSKTVKPNSSSTRDK
jgi:hypothetical protein